MNGKLGIRYTRVNRFARYDYTLLQDWVVWIPYSEFPSDRCWLPVNRTFENQWFKVEGSVWINGVPGVQFTVKAPYKWDGATAVPDAGAVEGSAVHDPMFQFCMAIAAAWGWSTDQVRHFGNYAFLAIMRMAHCKVARLYFHGVQILGDAFWYIAHFREWMAGARVTDGQVDNGRTASLEQMVEGKGN